ncbi:hypothetical protein BGZ54_002523 [Gamsiella multidivaricata]|nr:hypothetical protein BGZ54_002523 [Gamsiella multidivaricata]
MSMGVSPAQIYTLTSCPIGNDHAVTGDDSESLGGSDEDDHEARLQLSRVPYPSSTPPLSPLSPHIGSQPGTPYHGLIQSMAAMTTSGPNSNFGLGSPISFSSYSYFGDVEQGENASPRVKHEPASSEEPQGSFEEEQEGEEEEEEKEEEEERLFQCAQCQKKFLRQYNLNAHLKTHSLNRIYRCDQCEKSFLRPYDLSRHQRIHSKEKPYSCTICSLVFIRNDAIWRHYRKAHQGHPDVPTSRRDRSKQKSVAAALAFSRERVAVASFAKSKPASARIKVNARINKTATVAISVAAREKESSPACAFAV